MNSINAMDQALKPRSLLHSMDIRWVIFAGFPGAGKTAAAAKFGKYLRGKGLNLGIITNDHGTALIDSAVLRSQQFDGEELQGGCFCRKIEPFGLIAGKMADSLELNALLAEAVGTCTDLRTAFSHPSAPPFGKSLTISPLSVLVDPLRANQMFHLDGAVSFSNKIRHLYRRQLEEAEFIVINKIDLISESTLETLSNLLKKNHPHAQIFHVSARTGEGLPEWFECIMSREHKKRDAPGTDSEGATDGESVLAWLNCTVQLSSVKYWETTPLLLELANSIQTLLGSEGGELLHLKIALLPHDDIGAIATVNLSRADSSPEISQQLPEPIQSGELILNLRAEADPELLHACLNRAVLVLVDKHPELFARLEHCEHFRPGKPRTADPVPDLV